MPAKYRSLALSLVMVAAIPVVTYAQDAASGPVQTLDDGLLAIMKGGKAMGFAGRAARIGPVVDRVFDLPLMTRLAVGPAWTGMTPGDKTALVAAFRRLTIAQYAGNFDGWSGETFSIDAKVEARGEDRLVRTTLKSPKGSPTQLAYRLRQGAGGWRVIDVFYQNSISQLATRRSDFGRSVATGGAKGLIAHLDQLSEKAAR
ncbi:MAG: hopanoid biosynthesis protein HpnM [Sphingomonadales bacterium]|nr:hopanoid biosynthesis protein HpnM [Sphingomonadales bacterium]